MTDHAVVDGRSGARSGGPHPGVLAIVSLVIFLASLAATPVLTGGEWFIPAFAPAADAAGFFRDNATAAQVAGMLQFGSAVPLGIFAATAYARQLRLGVRVPGPAIGFFGGIDAAVFLMLSGLIMWVLGRPEVVADTALAQALAVLSYLTGGVGFVVGLGLLVAGIAVPSLILGFMPRWLAWAGLVIAALSELSFLSLVLEPLQFLLTVGRFGGLVWLIAAGFLLPRRRAAANQEGRTQRVAPR